MQDVPQLRAIVAAQTALLGNIVTALAVGHAFRVQGVDGQHVRQHLDRLGAALRDAGLPDNSLLDAAAELELAGYPREPEAGSAQG